MKQTTKLALDIVFGAVLPVLVLTYLTPKTDATPTFGVITVPVAYVIAALIPVAWVFIDLLAITRRFNFITSYIGLSAVINGLLAFWFVDGLCYAIKDTASLIVVTAIFAISAAIGRPAFQYLFAQSVSPDTPQRERSLAGLLATPDIAKTLRRATWLVVVFNALVAAINLALNLQIVTSSFGTAAFNGEVAQVNGLTRLILPIPNIIVFGLGFWMVYRQIFRHLPQEGDTPQIESEFWELMRLRDEQSVHR